MITWTSAPIRQEGLCKVRALQGYHMRTLMIEVDWSCRDPPVTSYRGLSGDVSVTFLEQDTHVLGQAQKRGNETQNMSCKENESQTRFSMPARRLTSITWTGAFSPDPSTPRLCIEC